LDYCITNYIVAIIFALTLGQIGDSTPETPNFITQVHQVSYYAHAHINEQIQQSAGGVTLISQVKKQSQWN
jgi:hypothetical protein